MVTAFTLFTLIHALMKDRDYMYAAGIITQDIIQIDYQGKPVVTYVDRGQFDETAQYYCASLNDETGKYETSDVWYTGCKWQRLVIKIKSNLFHDDDVCLWFHII